MWSFHKVFKVAGVCAVSVCAAFLASASSAAPGSWQQISQLPQGYLGWEAAARAADGRLYVVGGATYDGHDLVIRNDAYAFSPRSATWKKLASLPAPRALLAVVSLRGFLYAIGGQGVSGNPRSEVWRYDPRAGRWAAVAPLPSPRTHLAAVASGGAIYALGGWGPLGLTGTVYRYRPATNAWQLVTTIPLPRTGFAAVTGSDGRIYVMGGYTWAMSQRLRRVDVYDPGSRTWSTATRMPTARFDLAAVRGADGHIYAIAGCCDPTYDEHSLGVTTVEEYNPANQSWQSGPDMPLDPLGAGVFGLAAARAPDGRIFTFGGEVTSGEDWPYSTEVDAFTP
ncbi:MAG: Kelch repeat-containing protein [Gaiellales bacterium]